MTVNELLKRAAACKECGKEHKYRWTGANSASWASPDDGHAYRPEMDVDAVAQLRFLATGRYGSPWTPPKKPLAARVLAR